MKFICTSDWHLGNVFHGNDRLAEHLHFLGWLTEQIKAQQPDVLLIAGDVFDNANPSAAAQKACYRFLVEATQACPDLQVVVIAGNHDSANRLEAPRDLLSCHHVEVRGSVRRLYSIGTENNETREYDLDDLIIAVKGRTVGEEAVVLAVPFLRSDIALESSYSKGVNALMRSLTKRARVLYPGLPLVMMAHMYATGADIAATGASERLVIGGQEQVNLDMEGDRPDYLTCGHIHKRQHIWNTDWARYSGSVLPMSFVEADYCHGVDFVTLTAGQKPKSEFLQYQPERRLVSLPREGEAGLNELKQLIQDELPDRGPDGQLTSHACYLELKLTSDRVRPEDRAAIEAAVERKDAVICRLQQVLPAIEVATVVGGERFTSVDDILNRDPKEAVKECFQIMNNGREMNERQLQMLDRIMQSIQADSTEEEEQTDTTKD